MLKGNFAKKLFVLNFVLASFLYFSCQWNVIALPENTTSAKTTSSTFAAPTKVKASNGLYRCVTLSWDATDKAKYYKIYSSDKADTSNFTLVNETGEGVTSIDITEKSGAVKYYRVVAVSYSGETSSMSEVVKGSTMGVPVIQTLNLGTSGVYATATVGWWMPNCTDETYQDDVLYTVKCFKDEEGSSLVTSESASGSTRQVVFSTLTPNVTYYFQVCACVNSSDAEKSDIMDSGSVALTSPLAPENLSATQGISTDSVVLSWDLPDYTYIKISSGVYQPRPLYFSLERKLSTADDDDYQTICSYIGTVTEDDDTDDDDSVYFDCSATAASGTNPTSTNFALEIAEDGDYSSNYPAYVVGSTLTYTDTTAVRGKQYTYRVRSYTDDNGTKVVSSDISYGTVQGWLTPVATFSATGNYTQDESLENFTDISVSFTLSFEDYDLEGVYSYVVTSTQSQISDGVGSNAEESVLFYTNNISDIATTKHDFDADDLEDTSKYGYYVYKIYIIPYTEDAVTSIPTNEYTSASMSGKVTVLKDVNAMPVIENFSVTDGYSNKFVLAWTYDSDCTYTLIWQVCDEDGNVSGSEQSLELSASDFGSPSDGDTATYNHAATSGTCRKYALQADNGIKVVKYYCDESDVKIVSKTLGTPVITASSWDYDSITVTWPVVQMATTDYVVSAFYTDDESETELCQTSDESAVGYTSIEPVYGSDGTTVEKYSCTISCPSGYNDATISGKPITLSVTATSSSQDGETTQKDSSVCTMGPALVDTTVGTYGSSSMVIKWDAVDGASGYLIYRVRYTDGECSEIAGQSDMYYYDGSSLTVGGSSVDEERATLTVNSGVYTLTEYDCDQEDETSSYQLNQSMISWGLPFGYIVIPVKADGDSDDFSFEQGTLTQTTSVVTYTNLGVTKTATYGYGLATRAYKSESSSVQTVTWNLPYYTTNTPYLYYRTAGSTTNSWTKLSESLSRGATSVSFTPASATSAYEYAIVYGNSEATIEISDSFVDDSNTGVGLATMETDGENYDYTDVTLEKLNKGYLLAVDFSAKYGGTMDSDGNYEDDDYYYSEMISWNAWDYTKRSIGPDSAYISIKNYNLSSDWTSLANLDSDLKYASAETVTNTTIEADTGDVSMYVKPTSLADGTTSMPITSGPMQVLRDATHYYQLTLVRGDISATVGNDDSVSAWRMINDYEFAKMVMAVINDGMYKIGKLDFETESHSDDNSGGTVQFTHNASFQVGKEYDYTFTNYAPLLDTPSGQSCGLLKVSGSGVCYRNSSFSGSYPESFDSV
ncbi:MAG: hypothetical protein K6G52_06625, partial [Treponemataceae bacterium]|nr:hypothetical protein [Treponemataceae bacterium]